MASDIARLFALAHNYHLNPPLYQSRADAYDIKSDLFKEFIGILMGPVENKRKLENISNQLGFDSTAIISSGIYFMHEIIFSPARNYYEILGVRRSASHDTIKKNYRYMITMFHPDKCAACELDGETYAALLNKAYNTLKNSTTRQAYDEVLIRHSSINHKTRQAANNPDISVRDVATNKETSESIVGFLYQYLLSLQHPKLSVWGFMGASFLLVIYLSDPGTDTVITDHAIVVKPAIELREKSGPGIASEVKNNFLESEEPGQAYLEESVKSKILDSMLEVGEHRSADHSSSMTSIKQDVESSARHDAVMTDTDNQFSIQRQSNTEASISVVDDRYDPGTVSHQGASIDQEQPGAMQNSSSARHDSVVIAGFDGGKPGTSRDVESLTGGEDYLSKPLLVKTFSIPPELIMMKLIESYETGDIDKFSQLFSDDVITNHGRGRHHLVSRFSSLFNATTLRKINIKQLRVEPRTREEALLISDVEAALKLNSEETVRHFNGALVLRLVAVDSSMQIAEMVHSVH